MTKAKKKILLVEDDDELRKVLKDRLFRSYQILEAVNGEEAISACVDHRPDLVVLDLLLPKVDGFQFLSRIRSYPDEQIAGIAVVVLSNVWAEKDILQVQGLKIEEYFVKAHTKVEDVINRVNVLLGGNPVKD